MKTLHTRNSLPPRSLEIVKARPAPGDHQTQVKNAFALVMLRYSNALSELAKR